MRANIHPFLAFLFVCMASLGAGAAPSAGSSDELGGPLWTPLGAERAGNAEGTIPAWNGGIQEWPTGYQVGDHHPDPFAGDTAQFTVDAGNAERYAAFLTEGQRALLDAYPETWKMNVYPTRRSASYPDWVYEAVQENASTAELVVEGKGGVTGARVSSPFPIPRDAVEVIWNHRLRFRGTHVQRSIGVAALTQRGRYGLLLLEQEWAFPYSSPDADAARGFPNILFAVKSKVIQPALLSGNALLVVEPIDQTHQPRMSWNYSRNFRRVLRNPTIAYAFSEPNSDGLRTVDDTELYSGPTDRFEWRLLGKRELLIPYNAYRLHSDAITAGDVLDPNHIDPRLARYELHRVWVVEATLKADAEHIYSRRRFYLDEDSWQIAVAESWDLAGELWRVNEAHAVNYYEVPLLWTTLEVYHDLKVGRYLAVGLDNGRNMYRFDRRGDPRDFTPAALLYFAR